MPTRTIVHTFGNGPFPSTPILDVTPTLAFDVPSDVVQTNGKHVLAHLMPPYPATYDNLPPSNAAEYYRKMLPPGQIEAGTDHTPYGGLNRDRPQWRGPHPTTPRNFRVNADMLIIQDLIDAKFTGGCIDLVSSNVANVQYTRARDWADSINAVGNPGFKFSPMVDCNTGAAANVAATIALIQAFKDDPQLLKMNNKMFLSTFGAEKYPNGTGTGGSAAVTNWTNIINGLGFPVEFAAIFVGPWTAAANAPAFAPISQWMGRWGDAGYLAIAGENENNRLLAAYMRTNFPGKKSIVPVRPQDTRPREGRFWEGGGSRALENGYQSAIDGNADAVQLLTVNDFAENSHIAATEENGYGWLDLCAWWNIRFLYNQTPVIVRDMLLMFNRKQLMDGTATFTGPQTLFAVETNPEGSETTQDQIEVMAFLPTPGTVTIRAGATVLGTFSAPAGKTSYRVPAALGIPTAELTRGGPVLQKVTGPTISASLPSQDTAWKCTNSRRQA